MVIRKFKSLYIACICGSHCISIEFIYIVIKKRVYGVFLLLGACRGSGIIPQDPLASIIAADLAELVCFTVLL